MCIVDIFICILSLRFITAKFVTLEALLVSKVFLGVVKNDVMYTVISKKQITNLNLYKNYSSSHQTFFCMTWLFLLILLCTYLWVMTTYFIWHQARFFLHILPKPKGIIIITIPEILQFKNMYELFENMLITSHYT